MGWFNNLFGGNDTPVQLKLDSGASYGSARFSMPKAPPLDVSYDSMLRYSKRSELVYACIEKKAQAACDPVLIVERQTGDGDWETIEGHKLVTLLNKPNPWDDGESFMRAWIASENFADIFYAEIVRSGAGLPVALYPLNPALITPQYFRGPTGWYLGYYRYWLDGQEIRYQPEDLLIRRRHGLGSVFAGISCVQVALGTIDADTAMTEYVRAFFNNSGIPSGVITVKGRTLSEGDIQAIQQKWVTRFGRGGRQQGGPVVLQDEATYEAVGAGLDNLASETLTEIAETRICMAFGVPPVLIGSYVGLKNVNQKASFMGAMNEFWLNTMSPELKSIRNFLTWNLLTMFEPYDQILAGNIRVNWDMSHVMALQEDDNQRHSRARENFAAGMWTINEAREATGQEPLEEDYFIQPKSVDIMDEVVRALIASKEPQAAPVPPELPPPAPPKFAVNAYNGSGGVFDGIRLEQYDPNGIQGGSGNGSNGSKKNFEFQGLTLSREPTELEKSIDLKAIADSYEQGKESLTRVIETMRTDLIKQATKVVGDHEASSIHTLNLTPPAFADKSVTREIQRAFDEGQRQVANEAPRKGFAQPVEKKGIFDDVIRALVDLTISRVINEVASAAVNIFTRLGVLGYTPQEIENEIKAELEDRSDKPFEGIARQAINKAVNEGRKEEMAARSDEIRLYEYSAILDQNTCTPCADWDTAQADDPSQLPDTPNPECEGGPNCRCFIIAVFDTEAQ
jgi:HK97 family phage portal protein